MAKSDSNRDRIGKMFELLAPPLDEFISRAVEPELDAGVEWSQLVALKDAKKKGAAEKEYERTDPQVQLRMLTENVPHQVKPGWYPFDGQLSPTQRSFASELRDARNDWAHMKSFSDDDAYRILDTAERFLNGIGAAEPAERVRQLRLELRRVASDKDDRRALKSAVVMPESEGLAPWREILPPHDDVATGNFQASEFAADLYKVSVSSEDAGGDYADPVAFFSRTYLTEGLRDLIDRAVRRLSGDDNASPVINLQTNFGGGKTHSMLALWHLADGLSATEYGQEVQDLLEESGYEKLPKVSRVALVGNHISPSGSTKPDGTKVNTLWGELAWQLGGAEAYAIVAQADQNRTPPGEALHELIAKYSPALILIDEWVAYARSLFSRDDLAGGTFVDQFTFAQALTEAVKGTPGVLLAISIPASESGSDEEFPPGNEEEVGGAHGVEALKRLQNVVRRVADQWRPASADESFHIVRQRLFVAPDAGALATISATARKFGEMYRKHSDEFPREARDVDYEERIKRTYPIHPELFERLYEDWSSLERFQRTRGVLRLMNAVIHQLWVGEDQSPLIMPASVPLATSAVNAELTQYLEDSWKTIIDADVDGPNSEPAKIDKEKPLFGGRSVTKRLARTVFVGAAPTIGTSHKGLEAARVFLGAAVPGDVVGNFHSALTQLGDRATYFYSGSGKYWYDLQANISRRAKDHADRIHKEEVWAEIKRRLEGQGRSRGDFAAVHVCPEETGDIVDNDEARLVVLHPRLAHRREKKDSSALTFAAKAAEQRGSASRVNRNMVVFLAADEARMEELDGAVRTYLGWKEVLDKRAELNLTENQKSQAVEKSKQASETVDSRLLVTYQWALVPQGQPVEVEVTKVEGQAASLAERVSRRLGNDGALATKQAGAAIRHQLNDYAAALWKDGHVAAGDLWKTYAQYPYMPRLTNRSVLYAGLQEHPMLWEQDGFALADGYDPEAKRYRGLVLPSDDQPIQVTDQTLVVRPEVAAAQRSAESPVPLAGSGDAGTETATGSPGESSAPESGDDGSESRSQAQATRFFGSKRLSGERYAMDFKNVADEVLAHLASVPGATVTITLEIEATTPEGFDESQVRVVSENATTLKFEQSGFEEQ
ncbi:MAG TPA: Swt1 family HEPN domain-containing protein [Solirubrobacterales bacterium]|nr:Swt1 family HEPN domain-containing protein [Solirubrobacterales bacterium]